MNVLDLEPEQARTALSQWLEARHEPPYRIRQMFPRLWREPVPAWNAATDLPLRLRESLARHFPLQRPDLVTRQRSLDGTEKFLWRFADGAAVESVLIPEGRRLTLCISSQVGCAYGCVFCATGAMGFGRHLAPWEITAQVRELVVAADRRKPTNIVFMGMGEPLHNWAAVDRALTVLNDADGFGIGARRITVSTVGIVPNLARLARRPEQFCVALSLHAPTSEQRRRLMPVERKYPLPDVLASLQAFRRRVTFEYVMIAGENDSDQDAMTLAQIARPLRALVNLLPLHPGGTHAFTPTTDGAIDRFATRVRAQDVRVTVRRSRGLDISAACGQLRLALDHSGSVPPQHDGDIQ